MLSRICRVGEVGKRWYVFSKGVVQLNLRFSHFFHVNKNILLKVLRLLLRLNGFIGNVFSDATGLHF